MASKLASPTHSFIRPYNSATDEADLIHICQQTLPKSLKSTSAWALGPYLWCLPYGRLLPQFCFVLDSGANKTVGYIIGTPNLAALLENYFDSYLPPLPSTIVTDHEGTAISLPQPPPKSPLASWNEDLKTCLWQRVYDPSVAGDLLHPDYPSLVEEYPAHLHIDLLPEFQGRGFGRQLMELFLKKLKEEGVKGVHLIMDGQNFGAEKFYRAVGFERYREVLDRGASGEIGRHVDGTVWMVKTI